MVEAKAKDLATKHFARRAAATAAKKAAAPEVGKSKPASAVPCPPAKAAALGNENLAF
jgi:hypothetical protein